MLEVVLFQPQIPPNTGNVIRLCANTGTRLHLVEPLGFRIDDRSLARAGLDYHELTQVRVHPDWDACLSDLRHRRIFAVSTRAQPRYTSIRYEPEDVFVFGPETSGLPDPLLAQFDTGRRVRLPMVPGSRSLNLSNAVAVIVFEAWRQLDFAGAR